METLVRLAEVPQAQDDEAAQSYGEAEKLDVAPRPKPCDPASIADRLNAIAAILAPHCSQLWIIPASLQAEVQKVA